MDAWLLFMLIGALVVALVVVFVVVGRRRRRQSLHVQAKTATPSVPAPRAPTKELIDLALRQREEALVARRVQMEEAAREASKESPTTAFVPGMPSRALAASPEPETEIPSAPLEPALNPVQRMALEQWEEVNVVAAKPRTVATRPRPEIRDREPLAEASTPSRSGRQLGTGESPVAPAPKEKRATKPLEIDWGDVEVRRDVKKRNGPT